MRVSLCFDWLQVSLLDPSRACSRVLVVNAYDFADQRICLHVMLCAIQQASLTPTPTHHRSSRMFTCRSSNQCRRYVQPFHRGESIESIAADACDKVALQVSATQHTNSAQNYKHRNGGQHTHAYCMPCSKQRRHMNCSCRNHGFMLLRAYQTH